MDCKIKKNYTYEEAEALALKLLENHELTDIIDFSELLEPETLILTELIALNLIDVGDYRIP